MEWNFFSLYIPPAPVNIEHLPTKTQKKWAFWFDKHDRTDYIDREQRETIQQGFNMTYDYTLHYFDHNVLPDVDKESDYLERLEDAQDALDSVTDAEIEEFDVHDAIDFISTHYGIVDSDLLEHYDERQVRLSFYRWGKPNGQ